MKLKRFLVVTAALCLALAVVAGPAQAAETPTADAYSGTAGQVGSTDGGGDGGAVQETAETGAAGSAASSGLLPFTGLQLGLGAAIGIALLGGGLLLRRTARADRLG